MVTETAAVIRGKQPAGRADGTEAWVAWSEDDTDLVLVAHHGWTVIGSVRLYGTARTMASTIADDLYLTAQRAAIGATDEHSSVSRRHFIDTGHYLGESGWCDCD